MQDVANKPLKNITLNFDNLNDINKLTKLEKKIDGTDIKVLIQIKNDILTFKLKDKRFINNKLLNSLNLVKNLIND